MSNPNQNQARHGDLNPVVSTVLAHAVSRPTALALIDGDTSVSYGELARLIHSVAAQLQERGVAAGSRVVMPAEHRIPFIAAYFATHLLSAVAIPISSELPTARREHLVHRIEPCTIVDLDEIDMVSGHSNNAPSIDSPSLDSISDITFTTGTTGQPKGVVLSHRNLSAVVRNINAFIGNGGDDVEVLTLPLYRAFGLGRLRCVLVAGGQSS